MWRSWGASCSSPFCSGPFSQTTCTRVLEGVPSLVLPTMEISIISPASPRHTPLRSMLCPPHSESPSLCPAPPCALCLPTEEQSASCQHLTELQNLTKGPCYLDQVEVSYCSGHCPSSTNIMPEVSKGVPRGVRSARATRACH